MRNFVLFLSFAVLGAAQLITDVMPECAVDCITEGVLNGTPCAIEDSDCICEVDNYRNTYSVSQACVLTSCGAAVALGMLFFPSADYHPHFPLPLSRPF